MSDVITLAHGAGGKQTAELIDRVFKAHFPIPSSPGTTPLSCPSAGLTWLLRQTASSSRRRNFLAAISAN